MTWVIGIAYMIIATGFILGYMTYIGLSDRNSKWRFDEAELKRFHVEEKIAKKNIQIDGLGKSGPLAMIEKLKGRKILNFHLLLCYTIQIKYTYSHFDTMGSPSPIIMQC